MNTPRSRVLALLTVLLVLPSMVLAERLEQQAWRKQSRVLRSIVEPVFADRTVLITDFGAREGVEQYTEGCIDRAIDACAAQGGGTVLVPAGVFYTGPIRLKGGVRLHLSEGAVLKFSTDPAHYLPAVLSRWEGWDCYNLKPLIYAYGEQDMAVTGKGTLDGQADETHWWPWKGKSEFGWKPGMVSQDWNGDQMAGRNRLERMEQQHQPVEQRVMTIQDRLRPPFLQFYRCKRVLVSDVRIVRSPFWLIHPLFSDNVIVRGVAMDSHGPNNDGCDPESSRNVLIEDCLFDTGDDCIAIKSGRNNDGKRWNTPSEHIIVRRCIMKDGHGGVVCGSEITGGCRWVWAEDCTMDSPNLDRMLRIKSNPIRGGIIENIFLRNIRVGQCAEAVFRIEMKYEGVQEGPNMPQIRNIFLTGISSGNSRYGLWIDGFDQVTNVHGIHLRQCSFDRVAKPNLIVGAEPPVFERVTINGVEQK